MKQKVLIIEDEQSFRLFLSDTISEEGYETFAAANGEEGLQLYKTKKPHLILLDLRLGDMDGTDLCKLIREKDSSTPIIMLTTKKRNSDKVLGLGIGADDYVVKGGSEEELIARIKAVLRRSIVQPKNKNIPEVISFGNVHIDTKSYTGTRGNENFDLTKREIELLAFFIEHDGEVLDRAALLENVWEIKYSGTNRTLDSHILKLRKKIEEDPNNPAHLLTVHRVGYRFQS